MFGKLTVAFLILASLIVLAGCPMGDGGVSAEGKILDENRKPIKGAKVVLISRGVKDERESREDGSYDVGVIHAPVKPSGTLTVSKQGYETFQQTFSSRQELSHAHDIVLKALASPMLESK
jgi:hypothetical protein